MGKHGYRSWQSLAVTVLLVLVVVAIVFAWIGTYRVTRNNFAIVANQQVTDPSQQQQLPYPGLEAGVFGVDPIGWYWNALVLGVFAIALRSNACCGSCEVESDKVM